MFQFPCTILPYVVRKKKKMFNLFCSKQSAIAVAIVSVRSQLEAVKPSTVVFLAKAAKNLSHVSWSIPLILFRLISMQSDSLLST